MSGTDGNKNNNLVNVTWEQFQSWQRWDEFPERNDNPPMTVDMTFYYQEETYYLDFINYEYSILTKEWQIVASNPNFLTLLNQPIERWSGKSFKELILEFSFAN